MPEALLYQKLAKQWVHCQVCAHQCLIMPGQRGVCQVRENRAGVLTALNYGRLVACHIDPMEKKPLFHFLPGTKTYSFAALGCNFRCLNCQNYDISQITIINQQSTNYGEKVTAEEIIRAALENQCPSISYTYSEPTIFLEYAYETMKLARQNHLKNIWVSNGYMSPATLTLILPYLDAINIDLKSFSDEFYKKICQARLQPVLDNLITIKKADVWLEITTLLLPGLNDNPAELKNLAAFIYKELGDVVPWHISRFYPTYQMAGSQPTPISTLNKAYDIGRQAGLKYVYLGNVPAEEKENTFCPRCQSLIIKRDDYHVTRSDKTGHCSNCSYRLAGVW